MCNLDFKVLTKETLVKDTPLTEEEKAKLKQRIEAQGKGGKVTIVETQAYIYTPTIIKEL